MLRVKNLSVSYGPVNALQNVSIEVPEGKIIGIIGSNGAGKTTLLNTISGLVRCQSGEIIYFGAPLPKQPHKVVRAGLVQVPEGRFRGADCRRKSGTPPAFPYRTQKSLPVERAE